MPDRLHNEIELIREEVLRMGWFAHGMLMDAISTLINQDRGLAEVVRGQRTSLAWFHDNLEERVFTAIALYQPVARDMRTVVCSLAFIGSSERIGRYGKDIANIVLSSNTWGMMPGDLPGTSSLSSMGENVLSMIGDALDAYETGDLALLKDFSHRDDIVDAQRHTMFRDLVTYMSEDPGTITPCSHFILVGRYLERCGDHACGMAEKVHYMVTGERIEIT